jgi:hypothetical protein
MEEAWKFTNTLKTFYVISLCIVGLICLAILIKQLIKSNTGFIIKIIASYIGLILVQLLIGSIYFFKADYLSERSDLINISAYIFILIEYPILAYLISIKIKSIRIKQIILRSSLIFEIIALILLIFIKSISSIISIATTIESISMILACLYFFYELLNSPPTLHLKQESSFWLANGILFLSVCILPFYLAFGYFKQTISIEIFDYVGYAIVMILFTKASLCKDLV